MLKLWKMAYRYARSKRNPFEDSEDFASWVVEKQLTGRRALIKQLYIDWLRRKYSRKWLDKIYSTEKLNDKPNVEKLIFRKEIFTRLFNFLCTRTKDMLILYCLYNYTYKEIGDMYGITESRVNQIFKSIRLKVKRK